MKSLALGLLMASVLMAEPASVTPQCPASTFYAGITAPGVEVDLGRYWIEHVPSSQSIVQFRVGICKYADIRFNKDMAAIQVGTSLTENLQVAVLKQWGHDYDKWYLMTSQKVVENWYLDLNYDTSKDYTSGIHTKTYAGNFYYSKDKWAFGVDLAHNVGVERNTLSTAWAWYLPNSHVGLWCEQGAPAGAEGSSSYRGNLSPVLAEPTRTPLKRRWETASFFMSKPKESEVKMKITEGIVIGKKGTLIEGMVGRADGTCTCGCGATSVYWGKKHAWEEPNTLGRPNLKEVIRLFTEKKVSKEDVKQWEALTKKDVKSHLIRGLK